MAQHIRGLATLSPEHAAEVLVAVQDGRVECTVLAFDYLGEFSLLTGIMAGMGMSIQNGEIHTYARRESRPGPGRPPRNIGLGIKIDPLERRRIVDHFSGFLQVEADVPVWIQTFRRRVQEVIGLLESGGERGLISAKQLVNEMVAKRLAEIKSRSASVLFPVRISIENTGEPFTRLTVVSQDTPAFLYALSNALSLRRISIEHVHISTSGRRVEDIIDFVDASGKPITAPDRLDQVRLSVLLTKQFTHFLDRAPDPYAALARFEQLVESVLALPEAGKWVDLLSNPRILQDLARLLGASEFLWEDMIRLQYETLLPMLRPHLDGRNFAEPPQTLAERLDAALAGESDLEEQRRRLNDFKDQEIFRIDLDHILTPGADFQVLSGHLTVLAENVVNAALRINAEALAGRHGRPRTVGGLESHLAVLGLGKLGGAALGYASDIELLFVYDDNGQTDGPEVVDNREYFDRLIRAVNKTIRAKRSGIFELDLRLRPYGEDGPLACSLESFCRYYGPGGPAMSYERLALVRLRAVGGDRELGERVERLRDDFIYTANSIRIPELRELRAKQMEEKTRGGLNAKFSPGALVDLEYDVQLLQIMYGKDDPRLRTPRIHTALAALCEAGVLEATEFERLQAAYDFLRDLINGLRMLRGTAKDLYLPALGSDEYTHLARRMGYSAREGLEPARLLHMDFETHTAGVRTFVDKHFGRDSLPGPATGNVADLVLSDTVPEELRDRILREAGVQSPARAYADLKRLAGDAERKEHLARLVVLAFDILSRQPDPDMALGNWERLATSLPDPSAHFELLLSQPKRLEILMKLFSTSQFLADSLIRHPEYFDQATDPEKLRSVRPRRAYAEELRALSGANPEGDRFRDALRLYRRREFLRIGTRDLCLKAPLEAVTRDLSNLADALVGVCLERAWERLRRGADEPKSVAPGFCLLAFGKLGGRELNYSSDIDLLGVCADDGDPALLASVLESIRSDLSTYSAEGYVYRVDLRLRPYGIEGELVSPISRVVEYYRQHAALSEIQALLKLRPVAGDEELGEGLLDRLRPLLLQKRERRIIADSIRSARAAAIKHTVRPGDAVMDVKTGVGGIRDIEFLVQGLQLVHGQDHPGLLDGNTLRSLEKLKAEGILDEADQARLSEDYIFLRRVEHHLQILEDLKVHVLPTGKAELDALAKRVHDAEYSGEMFMQDIQQRLQRVRALYTKYLMDNQ